MRLDVERAGPSAPWARDPTAPRRPLRRRAIDWRMRRETCICETPTRSPISDCVRSSSKRRRSTSRSRSVSTRISRSTVAASSATREAGVLAAERVGERRRPPRRPRRAGGRARRRGRRRRPRAPRAPARRVAPTRSAISAGVGRAAELARHVLADAVDLDRELLQVARDAHRPALVAEVALELAEDRRDGERGERGLARRVEAVDRLEQPERGDLDQVVERLAAALVAARELARERQEALDELLARRLVALVVVALEQRAGPRGHGRRSSAGRGSAEYAPAAVALLGRFSMAPRASIVRRTDQAPGLWGAKEAAAGAGPSRSDSNARRRGSARCDRPQMETNLRVLHRRRGRGGARATRRTCSRSSATRSCRSRCPSSEAAELIAARGPGPGHRHGAPATTSTRWR